MGPLFPWAFLYLLALAVACGVAWKKPEALWVAVVLTTMTLMIQNLVAG